MQTLLYVLVIIILLVIIVVFGVWLWTLTSTHSSKDIEARDISARDVHLTSNALVGCNLSVCQDFKTMNAKITGRLMAVPLRSSDPIITLSRQTSFLVLTSPSIAAPSINLPQASAVLTGMIIFIINQSGASSFVVNPASGDAIAGSTSALTVTGSLVKLYLAGLNGTLNAYNWIQL